MSYPDSTNSSETPKIQALNPELSALLDESSLSWGAYFRRRIMAGLFAALPLFLTGWIVEFSYKLLINSVLNPTRNLILSAFGLEPANDMPWWWQMAVAPALVLLLLAMLLFMLGGLARSRVYRSIDWIFRHVPVVKVVYDTVSGFVESVSHSNSSNYKFDKVVLFDFPNTRVKSLGFVTAKVTEKKSGKQIYAVMLLTGVMPPTGFTLFVPMEDVVEIDWTPTQAIQAIVSGGISIPDQMHFD